MDLECFNFTVTPCHNDQKQFAQFRFSQRRLTAAGVMCKLMTTIRLSTAVEREKIFPQVAKTTLCPQKSSTPNSHGDNFVNF